MDKGLEVKMLSRVFSGGTRAGEGSSGSEEGTNGYPIVLTSDLPTMSDFGGDPFVAFMSTFPHRLVRRFLVRYFEPKLDDQGRPKFVSYGLRRIEAILAREFGEESVAVAHPNTLSKFVGKNTKMIGVSSHDPMGFAYVSRTYNELLGFGGDSVNYFYFKQLMEHPVIRERDRTKTKLVVGGPGAWQIKEVKMQDAFGIDVLVHGDVERGLGSLVRDILEGKDVPRDITMEKVDPERDNIPPIIRPASYGCIEITRGCGRGCQFCYPTTKKRYSFPIDFIMKEVEVNVKGGSKSIFVISDDIFLYEVGPNFVPNREKVIELFSRIAGYPGVEEIHLSHAAIAPVVADPKMIEELSPILLEKSKRRLNGKTYTTAEIGIETGSVRLMEKGMRGKALPFTVDRWHEIVDTGLGILNDNCWYPLCTFLVGSPDETEEDTIATLELFDRIKDKKLFYVPVIFIPIKGTYWEKEKCVGFENTTELQWEIIATAWDRNIKIWKRENERIIKAAGFFFYWAYLRWRYGTKSVRPVMNFLGLNLPRNRIPQRQST
ncbi:MAG: radical SAM protein [Candidatus Hadarchaeales archaeon]